MIDILTITKIALRALKGNKMRSILTSLGIIIGVASVIIMLAIGNGSKKQINEQIKSMGSNLLMVTPGASTSGGMRQPMGSQPTLTSFDAEAIKRQCPSVLAVAPIHTEVNQVIFGNQNWSTQIIGATPSVFFVRDWTIGDGRGYSEDDEKNSTKVCVIGSSIVKNLFGDLDPVGRSIRIKGVPFTIIGTLKSKGQSAMGTDQDDVIYIPLSTAQKKLMGTDFPGMVKVIMVKATDSDSLDSAEAEMNDVLNQRHRVSETKEADFSVKNLTQMMDMAKQATNIMTILLGSIASISLLVGGIGIMNIMLVSVTERTKEIGIRMAIGAKVWDIRLQFLIEAVILSLAGGLTGIIIGIIIANLITAAAGLPVSVTISSVLLSFLFSAFVGIFFGFVPAYKASQLNPIDALRYE